MALLVLLIIHAQLCSHSTVDLKGGKTFLGRARSCLYSYLAL